MNTIFQTQTGSTDAVATARQAFIDAELAKVGNEMAIVENKYGITEKLVQDWINGTVQESLEKLKDVVKDQDNELDDIRMLRRQNDMMKRGISRLDVAFQKRNV